ncbi:MAG TPA: hypothetical protein VL326_11280 [Kofleriaceae bacterium]|nr:hypothetical protein [Kofleriaceae bacterium]
MRSHGLLALTLATGCGAFAGGPTLGHPCDVDNPCNEGEACDLTAEGGPKCIEGSGDIDGDGIPNLTDFCEHQQGGASDEDRDGFGDECDKCPIAPPRDTLDPDGDAVESPCDPDPHEPGDEILLFESFSGGTTIDARWKPTTATVWKQQGGEVIATAPASGPQDYLTTLVAGKNNISVEASYRVDRLDMGSTPTQHIVAMKMSDPRPAGVASASCGVTYAEGGQGELVLVETNQSAMNQLVSGAFESANLYHAGGYVSGTRAACSVISNNSPLGTVQASITPDQLSSIALTTKAATARFQYVLVVGR